MCEYTQEPAFHRLQYCACVIMLLDLSCRSDCIGTGTSTTGQTMTGQCFQLMCLTWQYPCWFFHSQTEFKFSRDNRLAVAMVGCEHAKEYTRTFRFKVFCNVFEAKVDESASQNYPQVVLGSPGLRHLHARDSAPRSFVLLMLFRKAWKLATNCSPLPQA